MKKLILFAVLLSSLTLHAQVNGLLTASPGINLTQDGDNYIVSVKYTQIPPTDDVFTLDSDTTVIDSAAQKVSFNLKVADVCYLTTVINLQSKDIERQYDSLKKAFRTPAILSQLTDSTVLRIDSVTISALLRVSVRLRAMERFFTVGVFERFHAALRATGNAYLIGKLNELDTDDLRRVKDITDRGRNQLMGLN